MRKGILAALASVALVLSIAACDSSKAAPVPTPPGAACLTITTPAPNAQINGPKGTVVKGCAPANIRVLVFDHDLGEQRYYYDTSTFADATGAYSTTDDGIGDPKDPSGLAYEIVVKADTLNCYEQNKDQFEGKGDRVFGSLPCPGSPQVSVEIVVNQ